MNPQMRLVVMLAVLGASGSLLFAAEAAAPPADDAGKAEKVDSVLPTAERVWPASAPLARSHPEAGTRVIPSAS